MTLPPLPVKGPHGYSDADVRSYTYRLVDMIATEWWERYQADLENGVQWLNESAAHKFARAYPEISGFGKYIEEMLDKL